MVALPWSADYELGIVSMDDTHREFAALLNELDAVGPEDAADRLDALIRHTEAHFAQEDEWMRASGFPPLHCHRSEHERVLEVLRDVRHLALAGNTSITQSLLKELPLWFAHHAATMDAALASHIRQTGYDARAIAAETIS
ncbi:MAG: hemerythrin domain-containing protein [Methyloversatilis sp.]|jgi:hemerythrin|nr:hemerythrin domain-containing protein [Methyloversatilis sp.]MBP6194607.1 hemerythrin domain-containing protein [Methyloversatilis sp.]MBP9118469.1 hemerythrin domain-containing protein [Methyloversatilis sp.]